MEGYVKGTTKETVDKIIGEVKKIIVDQDEAIKNCLISFLCEGNVLLEGVPGLAKTLLVKTISQCVDLEFKRIQFTPDLMPSDVTGTKIFNMETHEFQMKKGPIFTNFLLADEINRTPPKTQAGLLEAMEEKFVTIDGERLDLPKPYMVFATQNPIEYEGTYVLPEALTDRFLMKIKINYPSKEAEKNILMKHNLNMINVDSNISSICNREEILKCREEIQKVTIKEELIEYIVDIVSKTRENELIEIGSSPRGSIALMKTAKAHAAMMGRDYVIPEDIKEVIIPTLIHRIILKAEMEIEGVLGENVIMNILDRVKVPR
ncbi:MAG: MoxR family ATPase [Anaeromicrobium sp.]|uniref:AAA family ATPase n=1 Tax=Anaeromicrobium sp. TaxID=1929132 RepID=UPI0025E75747|nr:MoxR family ATPase [Anaeromicrobium sp.]MCT4593461.1 MoxR family ATPase [Anaeromicrobium sp.]